MNRRLTPLALAAVLLAAPLLHAKGTPGAICAAAKQKAAAKKASDKLKCHSKALIAATPVDQDCLDKAESKFNEAISKAEGRGGCAQTNDAAGIESFVDTFVAQIVAVTPATTTTSTTLPCGGAIVGGVCWFRGSDGEDCGLTCAGQSRPYNVATKDYAGSDGTEANCSAVAAAFGGPAVTASSNVGGGIGCFAFGATTYRDTSPTTSSGAQAGAARYCACE